MQETQKKFSHSIRKFIRTQKAQIRRQIWDVKKQGELIKGLYDKFSDTNEIKAIPIYE